MKILSCFALGFSAFLLGCSGDKNLDDYRREQLEQNLARITSVSGTYTGNVRSKIDGTNLGVMILRFQAKTDIRSGSGQSSSEQSATASGSISLKSVTAAEIAFSDGYYDDISGDFQVSVPITDGNSKAKLSLNGNLSGDRFTGSIEVFGQPDYGGELVLYKNAPVPSLDSIEVGGIRLQQVNKLNYDYIGTYRYNGVATPFKLTFVNRDILPEQKMYKLFSPVRTINVNCDFSDFELNFTNAILDDKAGTLVGRDPYDQAGKPAMANLSCLKFETVEGQFGWNCEIQTKTMVLNVRLNAKM